MSDSVRPDLRAFEELETLVRHLGEELATFRRRALQAEARLKQGDPGGDPTTTGRSSGGGDALAELERENAMLRERVERAEQRVSVALERVQFIRQQAELAPARAPAADGKP